MVNTLLVMHIFFAISSLVFCGVSIGGVVLNKGNHRLLFNLNLVQAVITTFSGIALVIAQAITSSKLEVCLKLGIYLAVIMITEWTLYTRLNREKELAEQR